MATKRYLGPYNYKWWKAKDNNEDERGVKMEFGGREK